MNPASRVLMIEPSGFGPNPQTAADNAFQLVSTITEKEKEQAAIEFSGLQRLLSEKGIEVLVHKIRDSLPTPDACFPNNWISTHPGGRMVLYPMKAPNRRLERRPELIDQLRKDYPVVLDLSRSEERGLYLEGTGSIVIDHENKTAYVALSERSSSNLFYEWSKVLGYERVTFMAYDQSQRPVYHTNVVLSIGNGFCIACLDAIPDPDEKRLLKDSFQRGSLEMVEISQEQLMNFCGNCLQLCNKDGEKFLVMSTRAHDSFTSGQLDQLNKYSQIIHCPLDTIEKAGGGSARCMIAELF